MIKIFLLNLKGWLFSVVEFFLDRISTYWTYIPNQNVFYYAGEVIYIENNLNLIVNIKCLYPF